MSDKQYWGCPVLAAVADLDCYPAKPPSACLTPKKWDFSKIKEHILRNHSSDSKYKTTKAVVTAFNHQEIKGLWDVLKTEGNIHTEENWYRIVDAVRDQKGEHPMDRSMIQGPYNRKLEDVMREVSDAPRSVLNDISLRDCGVDFGSLGPDQNMAVCRTWARQGKRYIAPRQSINPQVAAERDSGRVPDRVSQSADVYR
ncbi:hypothetical protein UCREL1_9245 [Eutypa lata UCREL1]|uniref:Uncharacterized protein n=1 Tax=Eutypa lata (strain UCR-EL1) TaxID=1287681 RepID=M7TAX2_EUTLA|nr:hypothetical protein UCREL1_9245 [Eutypa lata UCREL1]